MHVHSMVPMVRIVATELSEVGESNQRPIGEGYMGEDSRVV
jgi:hypothetical protein